MKKLILLIVFNTSFLFLYAQEDWTVIHPAPTLSNLIDVHFISDNEGWAVGTNGTIIYTDNGGQSWDLQHSDPDESLWSIFFIDEQKGWACGWSKIYYTENAGQDWEEQDHPSCLGDLTDVYFINPDTGWIVGTYKIVLKTTDGGKNWTKIMNNIYQEGCFKRVEFYDHLHGCAVGDLMTAYPHQGFAMVTVDGGLTWTETTPQGCAWLTDVTYYSDMCVWACGYNGGLYRSIDGGYTWFEMYYGFDSFESIHFYNQNDGIVLEGHEARLTFDAGATWDSVVYINQGAYSSYDALMSWDEYKVVAVGYHGVMSRSLDGGSTWESMCHGLRIYFKEIGFFDHFNGMVIGINNNQYSLVRTYDGGYTWEYDTLVENGPFHDMYLKGQQCYLLNQDSLLIMKSLDAAKSWEKADIPAPLSYCSDMFFVDENTGFLCGPEGWLIRTNNGGQDWDDLSPGNNMDLRDLHFVDENNGWMIDYDGKTILHTTDGGQNWSQVQLGSSIIYQPEDIFFLDATNGFVNTDDGLLYKSTDGGETWELHYGFPGGSYSSIYFTSPSEGWYLSGRIYHSSDGGQNWDVGQFFGVPARSMFFLDENKGWMSGSNGFVATYDGTVGVDDNEGQMEKVNIFPNPAMGVLYVQLSNVPNAENNILIYNLKGQLVLQKYLASTTAIITLDISALAPGSYLLKLENDQGLSGSKFVKY